MASHCQKAWPEPDPEPLLAACHKRIAARCVSHSHAMVAVERGAAQGLGRLIRPCTPCFPKSFAAGFTTRVPRICCVRALQARRRQTGIQWAITQLDRASMSLRASAEYSPTRAARLRLSIPTLTTSSG